MAVDLQARTLLLAYGEDAERQRIKRLLKTADYRRTLSVESGRDAITRLLQSSYDLLITGTELRDTDSWRLIRMVRSGRFCPGTLPIVIVCDDRRIPLTEPLAQEHSSVLLALSDIARLPEIVAEGIEGYAKTKPTVLVIEDDEKAANLAKHGLNRRYDVEIAYDGNSGLAGAADFIPKPFALNQLRQLCERTLRYTDYVNQTATLQSEEIARHEVSKRVQAANHCLDTGQTGMAAHHLKNALAVCTERSLTDDEWMRLLSEFDGG